MQFPAQDWAGLSSRLVGGQLSRCPALDTPMWKQGVSSRLGCGGTEQSPALSREFLHILGCPCGNQECPSGSWVQDFGRGLQHTPGPNSNMLNSAARCWRGTGPSFFSGTRCLCCVHTSQPGHSLLWEHPCSIMGFTPGWCRPPAKGHPRDDPPEV